MSKVNPKNYYTVQGWMVSELGLKGNELAIYAIIYGFTQFGDDHKYNAGLQYLADWTNSTKESMRKCLNNLVDKGLLTKTDVYINNVKFCEYQAVDTIPNNCISTPTKLVGVSNKVGESIPQSGNKNIIKDNKNIIKDNVTSLKPKNNTLKQMKDKKNSVNLDNTPYEEVIEYLNSKTGKKYKSTTKEYRKLIKARFDEGYTLDDFKVVIDNKCLEWLGDESTKQWLRPTTLFGEKFERYLTEEPIRPKGTGSYHVQNTTYTTNSEGRRRL